MAAEDGFDPLERIPHGTFASRAQLQEVNLRVLTPFQRALLTIDGTVTRFIEAYTMEPVEVMRIRQDRCLPCEEHRWLEPDPESLIMEREVLIRGGYTGTLYAYAISHILSERLPPRVRERLEVQGEGIGRILQDEKMETRREVLWFGREHLDSLPFALKDDEQAEFISRAYRIIWDGRPVAMINERFPVSLRRIPAHH
jgi:chorismate-pyruvate lyase